MNNEVIVLYWETLQPPERNVAKIVQFLGGVCKLIRLSPDGQDPAALFEKHVPRGACIIASAGALAQLRQTMKGSLDFGKLLTLRAANILVFGFEPTAAHNDLLRELTVGGLCGVESPRGRDLMLHADQNSRELCRQLTGLSFGAADPETDFTFTRDAADERVPSLVRIGGRPFLVRTRLENCQLLLSAGSRVADLDAPVSNGTSILQFFSSLIPTILFLYGAMGDRLWHNDTPRACFIVDDPLLRRRYGFLDYQKLLALMERERFCTSIAFIPWNYRRSDRQIAELFKTHPGRYSLCVHGCDHTAGEFAVSDDELLEETAHRAIERMALHQKLSGLAFDDVMVFPQGLFSTAAMQALGHTGYLAAINSTPYPAGRAGDSLTLQELLDVAVTRYSNFPLFVRRYPKSLAELAIDLFLGKPALIVEHHGYFRDGYGPLAEVITKLNASDERLKWTHLGEICSRACLKKVAENGDIHVRFYCDRFCLQNETDHRQNYVTFRRQVPGSHLSSVSVNGQSVGYSQEADYLRIPLSLGAGHIAEVRIVRGEPHPLVKSRQQRRMDSARVFVRRRLCEFRDNYVHTRLVHHSRTSLCDPNPRKSRPAPCLAH